MLKKREKKAHDSSKMFYNEAEDESYKRYKNRCYRNLIIKSLLTFFLGLLIASLFKL